tara:strand:- start:562 stop:744 length:183 start_codon:yes stop_codon:yes gene_type:complete
MEASSNQFKKLITNKEKKMEKNSETFLQLTIGIAMIFLPFWLVFTYSGHKAINLFINLLN